MNDFEPIWECGNDKCKNSIATSQLNNVQLKALDKWMKSCRVCGKLTKWVQKIPLINTPQTKQLNGGKRNVKNKADPNNNVH